MKNYTAPAAITILFFVGLYALDHTHQARRAERAALHQATMAEIDAEHEAWMTRMHSEREERDNLRHAEREARKEKLRPEREARAERLRLVQQLRALAETGLDFFSLLEDAGEDEIEAKSAGRAW